MKLVIDIPQAKYNTVRNDNTDYRGNIGVIYKAAQNGTPLDKVVEDIKQEIEKAIDEYYYSEHDLGVRQGFRFALEIIDKHTKGESE